ncbi:DUF5985 family protein [Candidatus Nitrospira nitrificans]|uniref:Uncharacterized protein n=1 Tax=Candidatus Nitrospira nitrificans TaxID=1742973 RepID=A0A0S4LQZ8_9BACT|nr:DUF5985 family protein [Candidatus Nitrospira nitrificans]CUS39133.1 conserved membrane hypothetical protein [Candidatus Nitrospira nitrificans]
MATLIYSLCTLTAVLCAWLLLHAYGGSGNRLLFWSGLFFAIVAGNNMFLMVDKLVFPFVDLTVYRYTVTLVAHGIFLFGLIFERE